MVMESTVRSGVLSPNGRRGDKSVALKWSRNRFREPLASPPVNPAVREFHRSLEGYEASPLVSCAEAAQALGLGALWVKDESKRFGLNAFKALGASWAMSRIGGRAFATATDGNHGRAVAWMSRRMNA